MNPDALLQTFLVAALIIGAAFLIVLIFLAVFWVFAAVMGVVMIARQARGEFEPEPEEDEDW